jgi:hypothetical protein
VSIFVLSPEIEDRGEVEVATESSRSVSTPVTKKSHFNCFYRDTPRRHFRPRDDKE